MECKFWLHPDTYEISEAYSYQLTNPAKREIRKIIYDHFDYITIQWNLYFNK